MPFAAREARSAGTGAARARGSAARKRCGRRCVAADAGRADNRACPSHAAVAQWIEHRPSKPAVGGSIPSCRAIISDKARPRFDAKGCATLSFTSRRRFEAVRNAWPLGGPQFDGGCSSAGRVPDCDSGCRGFESHQPPQNSRTYRDFSSPVVEDGAAQFRFRRHSG